MPPSRCAPPLPPRIQASNAGAPPHDGVLAELGALGLARHGPLLSRALRRVGEWQAGAPEGPAPASVRPEPGLAELDPELLIPLRALDRLLRDPDLDDATREAVAFACLNVALWAEDRGAHRTAVGFLHAAEDAYPDNPHYAYNLGRVARKMALYEEAEAWLKWAHYVARGDRNWEVATLALSGLGNLHRQRGSLPRARRFHEVARRVAGRHDLRTLEGDALYDLCVLSFTAGEGRAALEYAREALRAYGTGHTQVYRLANDIAWYWMDRYGDFESAVDVFNMLLPYIWEPPFRVLLTANLARAAAGAGWREMFERMWIETWTIVRHRQALEGHAAALIQLSRGAGTLGEWERALYAADEALSVARARKEGEMIVIADTIARALGRGVIEDERIREVFRDRGRSPRVKPGEEASELVLAFLNALRARRDGAPESPTRALVQPRRG